MKRVCVCGCSFRMHFEASDDGSGCINCKWCDHFDQGCPPHDFRDGDICHKCDQVAA